MKRSVRLAIVLDLAQRKEDDALSKLKQAQENVHLNQQQLDQLVEYQAEYHQKIRAISHGRINLSQYQTSQHFLFQLGQAIVQQQAKVNFCQQELDAYREQWLQLHLKKKGMNRYILQCRKQELIEEDKREQKEMDEFSSQQFSHFRYKQRN